MQEPAMIFLHGFGSVRGRGRPKWISPAGRAGHDDRVGRESPALAAAELDAVWFASHADDLEPARLPVL